MNSSALYLAIVVVWLIVLVPMLMRRDGADPEPGAEPDTDRDADRESGRDTGRHAEADEAHAPEGSADDDPDSTLVLSYDEYVPGPRAGAGGRADGAHGAPVGREGVRDDGADPREPEEEPEPAPVEERRRAPVRRGAAPRVRQTRARVIARRRRRTLALCTLLAATGAAVGMDLGPWWVLVPPVLLLAGHLVLLREAAKADAERRAAAEDLRRRRAAARRRAEAARAARTAEVIDMPAPREQEVYDQYADAHQRAVGD
ncbi:divisome protein SepX/GlpR [Nocardiopsis chromatogenes]|uniref:divisome protein SepX/GlpR n=1 Tax=Nocardiopsis chromatogenes TaxID=280239 RepID=UPI0003496119|nr:hypothetical protein [Nocardiopsis chromatogenes]